MLLPQLSKTAVALLERMIGAGVRSGPANMVAYQADKILPIIDKAKSVGIQGVTKGETQALRNFSQNVSTHNIPVPDVKALQGQADEIATIASKSVDDVATMATRPASRSIPIEQITGQARWNQARDVRGNPTSGIY